MTSPPIDDKPDPNVVPPIIPAVQSDALSVDQKMARAQEARRLLEHPMLKQAFANLKLNYFEAFCNCPPENVHDRDRVFHCAAVLADVETHLRLVMHEGSIAREQITNRNLRGQH